MKRVVARVYQCPDGVDVNADQVTNRARDSGFDKLQFESRLGEKIQRHHEQKKRDRKK